MGSLLDNLSMFHYVDHVRLLNRGQPMTDRDNRLVLFSKETLENTRFRQCINRTGWFIENNNRTVTIKIARQTQPLLLAT